MKHSYFVFLLLIVLQVSVIPSVAQEIVKFDMKTWKHKQNRQEFARIFQGATDQAIAGMNDYLKEHPDDTEVLYGLSVAYYSKKDQTNGILYFSKAINTGMPVERFMAGPREILAPLYKTGKFRKIKYDRIY